MTNKIDEKKTKQTINTEMAKGAATGAFTGALAGGPVAALGGAAVGVIFGAINGVINATRNIMNTLEEHATNEQQLEQINKVNTVTNVTEIGLKLYNVFNKTKDGKGKSKEM